MHYHEKPEASKCSTCRRRGRDNYHNKKVKNLNNNNHIHAMKKMRCETLSPQEFCSLVNTMTEEEDEVIDVHTLLEYASHEYDGRVLEDFRAEAEESTYMTSSHNHDCMGEDLSVTNDSDEDREMAELFTATWLPDLASSPSLPNFH